MEELFGQQAIMHIMIQLVFLFVTWWALQIVKLDFFVKNINSPQAKVLQILLTIAIGSTAANFFLSYYQWATRLQYLF
ncbi:DUF1146 family protein [Bacillus taeanensis]|uniref:DUF1146 domain-containing protein n=1 Tax=Bacillus taeanensis TaxID=273032 RepID=A0A366XXR7_9BACI|nr:DUF1146 family protein [Bacillus taeanensis]RBW68741.1 DUF1146 domain-containing protein [Bacillus taeanensis]